MNFENYNRQWMNIFAVKLDEGNDRSLEKKWAS
jgi:hypothetical protein